MFETIGDLSLEKTEFEELHILFTISDGLVEGQGQPCTLGPQS
jgi:hypothetical protein